MATSNLYDTYGDFNKQIVEGKTQTITCVPCGDPQFAFWRTTGGLYEVGWKTWYKATCVSSAAYNYVGMTRAAAEACAAAMDTKFRRQKLAWEFREYVENNQHWFGWVQKQSTVPVLDSNIRVIHDQGAMYHVEIQVNCVDEKYTVYPATVTFSYPPCMNDI